jgi:hypothetical protein
MRPGEVAGLTIGDFAWLSEGIIRVGHSNGGPLRRTSSARVNQVGPRGTGRRDRDRALAGPASRRGPERRRPRVEEVTEIFALQQLHHQVQDAALAPVVHDVDHVAMLDGWLRQLDQ